MNNAKLAVLGLAAAVALGGTALAQQGEPAAQPAGKPQEKPAAPSAEKKPETKPEAKPENKPAEQPASKPVEKVDPYVLGFKLKDIDGNNKNLEDYKGSVVLMVNVASKCGYTSQYKGLEKLYQDKKDKGLVIIGFPANNFGNQEPGTEADIKKFCTSEYSVTFPMFSKISVKGDDQHPLYRKLAAQPAPVGGDPKWNFTKFLVDRSGNVVARFDTRTAPNDTELNRQIDDLLAKK